MRKQRFRMVFVWLCLMIFLSGMISTHGSQSQAGNPFPRKVLLELFTATWCGPCAEYGHLADELAEEFGPEKVILVRNHCWKDGLNTAETDARADYYRIAGVPAMVTAGYRQSHPAEVDKNRRIINQSLSKNSPFRIMMQYTTGFLKINLQNGTAQSFDNLRLITLLYEVQVWYEGQNGEKLHKKVVRDYIEDEKGAEIAFSSNEMIEQTIPVRYRMKQGQTYVLVCFLQDAITQEIYQAESIQTNAPSSPLPDLVITKFPSLLEAEEESPCTLNLTLSNTGNQSADRFHVRLYLSPMEDWDTSDDVRMSETEVIGLETKASTEIAFRFVFPEMGTGTYSVWLFFLVDSLNEVPESNENNLFKHPTPVHVKDAQPKILPPVPVSPAEGESIVLPYTFQWNASTGASQYLLIITTLTTDQEQSLTKLSSEPFIQFSREETFLAPYQEYRYAVIAFTPEGEKSVPSHWIHFSVKAPPKTYFQLTAVCRISGIALQWDAVPEAEGGYAIYQKRASDKAYPSVPLFPFLLRETNYTITEALIEGETYCFLVRPAGSNFLEIPIIESIEVCLVYHPVPAVPTKITIDPPYIKLYPEQTKQLTVVVYNQENQAMPDVAIQWTCLGDIGSINANGWFIASKAGIGQILASVNELEARSEVVVINYPITIVLQIGNNTAFLSKNQKISQVRLESPPFIQNQSTMVPLRFVGETFGAQIEWNADYRMIILRFDRKNQQIILTIDSVIAYLNEKKTLLPVPPVIREGRTMVPLRFLAEAIECSVEWDEVTQQITLVYTD